MRTREVVRRARRVMMAGRATGCLMKFLIEFQIKPGQKNKALEAFELRGPNRNPGVSFLGAWVGTQADVVFVLVKSSDEALVTAAADAWRELGEVRITQVIEIEQY